MFGTCLGSFFDMLRTCFGHVLGMFGTCFGHVCDMFWTCFGNMLGMFSIRFGQYLGQVWVNRFSLRKVNRIVPTGDHRCLVSRGFQILGPISVPGGPGVVEKCSWVITELSPYRAIYRNISKMLRKQKNSPRAFPGGCSKNAQKIVSGLPQRVPLQVLKKQSVCLFVKK